MAELRHAVGIDRRLTRAQVVQPPCAVGVVGRRKSTPRAFVASCVASTALPGTAHTTPMQSRIASVLKGKPVACGGGAERVLAIRLGKPPAGNP